MALTKVTDSVQSINHDALLGLTDDDHTQYVLNNGTRTATTLAAGSGDYVAIGGGASASAIRFLEPSGSGTNYTAFKAQAQAGNVTYILPAADATVSGYALKSDGAGNLSWGAAGGGGATKSIAQAGHGLSVGNPVYYTGSAYAKADADTETTAEVVGIVSAVADTDNFTLLNVGWLDGLSGLTAGTVYFLSGTAGALTATEPTTAGTVSKPLLIADSTTSGYFFNMRGQVVGGGVAGVREITTGTATAGQTAITAAYTVGYVDVYVNGVRLMPDDYTATSGTSITLDTGMALNDEYLVVTWTVVSLEDTSLMVAEPGGRLTLTTGTPVMASEAAAQTTIYYTPYKNDLVPLYDGTTWSRKRFTELSIAMASSSNWASGSNYDLYVYNDGGTLRLVTGAAWTNDTTRSESLTRLNGMWTNTASMTGRYAASSTVTVPANRGLYVGTFRASANGTTTWELGGSAAGGDPGRLFVWNCYNRVYVDVSIQDSTASWTYQTAAWRNLDNNANNSCYMVRGLNEDSITAIVGYNMNAGSASDVSIGVSLDNAAPSGMASYNNGYPLTIPGFGMYHGRPGLGYHYLVPQEYVYTTTNAAQIFGSTLGVIIGQFSVVGMF